MNRVRLETPRDGLANVFQGPASVRPWEMQPGMEGHSATNMPVSSGSSVTSSFILGFYSMLIPTMGSQTSGPRKIEHRYNWGRASLWLPNPNLV